MSAISLGLNSFGPIYSFGQIMAKRIFLSKRKVWPSNPPGQKERYLELRPKFAIFENIIARFPSNLNFFD